MPTTWCDKERMMRNNEPKELKQKRKKLLEKKAKN
jgi:hypothetical protein